MTLPDAPHIDQRRRKELREELMARARAWLPDWRPRDGEADFAAALFEIAARIGAEVTQRLDKVPEKSFRGFLDWLGVRAEAGRAAEIPVVFGMGDKAVPIDAGIAVQLQASAGELPVTFETKGALRILPSKLLTVVAADPAHDRFTRPPAALSLLEGPAALPDHWTLRSAASADATRLQLDPEVGLEPGTVLCAPDKLEYRVTGGAAGIVTIEPPLAKTLEAGTLLDPVKSFDPFGKTIRNRQVHALYIGAKDALNLESAATIEVTPARAEFSQASWSYWGKKGNSESGWQDFDDIDTSGGRLLLKKSAGAIEEAEPDGLPKDRWIRASYDPPPNGGPLDVAQLLLKINSKDCGTKPTNPDTAVINRMDPGASGQAEPEEGHPSFEGFANTTPLVMDGGFYPLGLEPRQFDAFYLGCKEAFSKPNANVILHFELDDGFASPAVAAEWGPNGTMAFAVGKDGNPKRLRRPFGTSVADEMQLTSLQAKVPGREAISLAGKFPPGLAMIGGVAYATAGDGQSIWLWQSDSPVAEGSWFAIKAPREVKSNDEPETLLLKDGNDLILYARVADTLHRWNLSQHQSTWTEVNAPPELARIVPVTRMNDPLEGHFEQDGLVAVGKSGVMYRRKGKSGSWEVVAIGDVVPETQPMAGLIGTKLVHFAICEGTGGKRYLAAIDPEKAISNSIAPIKLQVEPVGNSFALAPIGADSRVALLLTARDAGKVRPEVWYPFHGNFAFPVAGISDLGIQATGPFAFAPDFVLPAITGSLSVLAFDPGRIASFHSDNLTDAATFTDGNWQETERLVVEFAFSATDLVRVDRALPLPHDEWLFALEQSNVPRQDPVPAKIYQIEANAARTGRRSSADDRILTVDDADKDLKKGTLLELVWKDNKSKLHTGFFRLEEDVAGTPAAGYSAKLDQDVPAKKVEYRVLTLLDKKDLLLRPWIDIYPLPDPVKAKLTDPEAFLDVTTPASTLQGVSRVIAAENRALLRDPWSLSNAPGEKIAAVAYTMRPTLGIVSPPPTRNPELSWEYWNGSSWSHIPRLSDGTSSLVSTGEITLYVPDDLQQTDVVGRMNFWIRARLVSGDFGKETVKVTPGKGGVQIIERLSNNIHAPHVGRFWMRYQLCCPIVPDRIVTLDGGTLHDQTDANRDQNAVVRTFAPLAWELSRFSVDSFAGSRDQPGVKAPPPDCVDCATGAAWIPGSDKQDSAQSGPVTAGRALYLGFSDEIQGNAISLLFLVREVPALADKPLRLDTLANGKFQRIEGVEDETRGLTENGIVSFSLAQSPEFMRLFGQEGYWLRILPDRDVPAEEWLPQIAGVYLNAAWASATETQTQERLGSSDGAPGMTFTLARPPILKDSLKLRVRESLSDEDVDALRLDGKDIVSDELGPWKGPWVLWREVPDVADSGKHDRVYSLDDDTGLITFGDGQAGMIPPIGRDNIVAESYQKVGGEAANAVRAWDELNLITPLPGVERVAAPVDAAGGASAQDPAATVRFAPTNLNIRGRALTLRDFETLALQFSPLIGQARALPRAAGLRLVVAGRSPNLVPSRSLRRTLKNYLAGLASPAMAQTLDVTPPVLVPLRIALKLEVAGVEASPAVAQEAVKRLVALLDPGSGGLDGTGWRLGAVPSEADIAAVLVGIDGLQSIKDIQLSTPEAGKRLEDLKPTELLQLTGDDIRIDPEVDAVAA